MTEISAQLQQKLRSYRPSAATVELVKNTPKLFLVGVAGAGKDSIIKELLKTGEYHLLVSYTTRQPRENNGVMEQDGVEYHFISPTESERMVDAGAYVEANLYGGNIYGSCAAEMQVAHDTRKIAITDMEIQGVETYMRIGGNTKAVFVLPPSYESWQARLMKRYGGSVDHADLQKRMTTALRELEHALHTPYFFFVVNDRLETAVDEVAGIVADKNDPNQVIAAHQIAEELAETLQ